MTGGSALRGKIKCFALFLLFAVMSICISGCGATTSDSLYKLPEATDNYKKIQQKIDEIQAKGEEFAAPMSGYNRQAIQLHDLDSDGEEEVVAFFRTNGDKPLKIYILKSNGEDYNVVTEIEGDGAAVDSISYVDMDGDGVSELLLGWQMSSSVKLMTIYSIREYQPVQLATDSYSTYIYCDMDGDGDDEVTAFHTDASDGVSDMTMYMLMHDGEMVSYSANLSSSADSIAKVQSGMFGTRGYALYVDSARGNGVITDIIVYSEETLTNITVDPETGDSGTYRPYSVYSSDIDRNGYVEVPIAVSLPGVSDTTYYLLDWNYYTYDGEAETALTTYHNYSDGWYLIVPGEWKETITIRREDHVSGERAVVFSVITSWDEDKPVAEDFLKIYSLSGDNKEDRSVLEGRFVITTEEDKIYAGEIVGEENTEATMGYVRSNFGIIHTDWTTSP